MSVPLHDGAESLPAGSAGDTSGPAELMVEQELTPSDPKLAMQKTLEDIRRYLQLLSAKASDKEGMSSHRQSVLAEWHQVATVVDRLCCVMYFVITLLITAVFYGHKSS